MAVTIRKNDVKASNLLGLSVVLATLAQLLYPAILPPGFSPSLNIAMQVGTVAITAAQCFAIRAGYRWVKILTVVFIVVGVLGYVLRLPILNEPAPKTALFLVSSLLQVWVAFILLKDLLRRPVAEEAGGAGVTLGGHDRVN